MHLAPGVSDCPSRNAQYGDIIYQMCAGFVVGQFWSDSDLWDLKLTFLFLEMHCDETLQSANPKGCSVYLALHHNKQVKTRSKTTDSYLRSVLQVSTFMVMISFHCRFKCTVQSA